jgi:hypothetical protein
MIREVEARIHVSRVWRWCAVYGACWGASLRPKFAGRRTGFRGRKKLPGRSAEPIDHCSGIPQPRLALEPTPPVPPPQVWHGGTYLFCSDIGGAPLYSKQRLFGQRGLERDEGYSSRASEKACVCVKIDAEDFNGESRVWYSSLHGVIRPDLP